MKNFFKAFGIIALAAVIGFSMAACSKAKTESGGDKDSDSPGRSGKTDSGLNGTWISSDGNHEWKFNNGDFEVSFMKSPLIRGTYTTSGGAMTIKVNELYGGNVSFIGMFEKKWYTKDQAKTAIKDNDNPVFGVTGLGSTVEKLLDTLLDQYKGGPYSLSGNSLTMGGTSYKKK